MISFLCSHCGAALRMRRELAGATAACPRCGKTVQAPLDGGGGAGPPTPPPSRSRAGRDTRAAFETASAARDSDLDFLQPPQGPGELGRLGSYRVLKVLGAGAMGMVLLAEDVALKRQVALKVMKKSQAGHEVNRLRFLREAQAAAAIEHDHIVPIYQVGEDAGVPYLAMKLLRGESLEDRLNRENILPAEEVIRIGQEIAEGLAEAHERGLIHRDIKPANIWLEEGRDRVKIVDFGLALASTENDARLTQANFIVGTPAYMSPEQAEGDDVVDHRTDLFSLGGVLYRMCTGELPFKGKTTLAVLAALATKTPRPPIDLNPDLPRALSALIVQLLQKDPDARPRSARLVVAALEEIRAAPDDVEPEEEEIEELQVVEESEPERPRPRPKPRRRGSKRGRGGRREQTLEQRVIKLAIWVGVLVFLLLAFLIIKKKFFPARDGDGKPETFLTTTAGVFACLSRKPVAGNDESVARPARFRTWMKDG